MPARLPPLKIAATEAEENRPEGFSDKEHNRLIFLTQNLINIPLEKLMIKPMLGMGYNGIVWLVEAVSSLTLRKKHQTEKCLNELMGKSEGSAMPARLPPLVKIAAEAEEKRPKGLFNKKIKKKIWGVGVFLG